MALTLVNEKADEVVASSTRTIAATPDRPQGSRRRMRGAPRYASTRTSEETRHETSRLDRCTNPALAAALARRRVARARAAHVRQPVADRGQRDSQKANAAADQAIYQAVKYMNANKKGPALIVIPGEIKSNNATFLQKFTAEQHRRLRRARTVHRQFPGARALEPRPAAQRIRARLQPGRPGPARKFMRMGKLKTHQVCREVRHPEGRADRRGAAGLRRPRARPDGRHARRLRRLARRRAPAPWANGRRLGADQRIDRRLADRHALQDHQRRDHRAGRAGLHRGEDGGRREVDVGARRVAVAAGRRSLDTMVQRLVQKSVWEIDSKYK